MLIKFIEILFIKIVITFTYNRKTIFKELSFLMNFERQFSISSLFVKVLPVMKWPSDENRSTYVDATSNDVKEPLTLLNIYLLGCVLHTLCSSIIRLENNTFFVYQIRALLKK